MFATNNWSVHFVLRSHVDAHSPSVTLSRVEFAVFAQLADTGRNLEEVSMTCVSNTEIAHCVYFVPRPQDDFQDLWAMSSIVYE